jgi:hypothetical protein
MGLPMGPGEGALVDGTKGDLLYATQMNSQMIEPNGLLKN